MAFFRPQRAADCAMHKLQELCLYKIVDNLDMLGDVGDTPAIFLERILAHCTLDQLKRIEDASKGRDLESITNEFWHRFYQKKWGAEATGIIENRVQKKGLPLRWRALYDHKVKQEEQIQAKCVSRLRELFIKEKNEKLARTVQVCARRPEVKKRAVGPQSPGGVQRGRLLAKAKKDYVGSFDAQRRKSLLQRQPSSGPSVLGKRPSPSLTSSPGPVQKRPAPSSPQNQGLLRRTEPPTRPREQGPSKTVLGKRPSELSGSSAQKRLALGEPQIEAGYSRGAPGKSLTTGAGGAAGRLGVGDPSGANSIRHGRPKVWSGVGYPEETKGSIGAREDVAERTGRGREAVQGAGRYSDNSGSDDRRRSLSVEKGSRVVRANGASQEEQTKRTEGGRLNSDRVKELAAGAAERRAGMSSVSKSTSGESTRLSREDGKRRRDQPDIGSPERRPQKRGMVSQSGSESLLKSQEQGKVSILTDDEVLWDDA
ncbi:RNA polymerase II transcription factor SIII subunit A [Klebsormidium nitens]|uniref:RNA polymerase II transcription factor SIII subunit A n=1 Tax=Klebsormidium nitens TaxID=105231 RepID=A0A1Y1HJS1_KLENI|nr:RNA polymerase II transcription factor SIII subunit A [Klebsormidium nitens]|eukprot:GAQ77802.1 RNA polymerase II transcription factor SIII subunit A [Klebsormidium nitens]